MGLLRTTLLVVSIVAASPRAFAQPDKPGGKQKFAAGKVKYAAGDYRGAAELFDAAYQADPDPAYIYNVGQAYRRSAEASPQSATAQRDCYQAMVAYKKFLGDLPRASNRAEVEGYIVDTRACAGALATDLREPDPVKPVEPPIVQQPPPPPPPIERAPGTSALRWTGIAVGAVGAVALGVGIYYTKLGRDRAVEHDRLVDAVNAGQPDALRLQSLARIATIEDEGEGLNTRAYAGWGIGGAMLIGGTVLYLLGGTRSDQLVVAPAKSGAMVLGGFRF